MTVQATRPVSRVIQTTAFTLPLWTSIAFWSAEGTISWWIAVGGLVAIAAGLRQVWQSIQLDDQGVTIRRRPGRERVAWDDIARMEVRWLRARDGGQGGFGASQPLIERTDGRRVRAKVLADLVRDARSEERHALRGLLADRAAEHDFELVIHGPGAEGTRHD